MYEQGNHIVFISKVLTACSTSFPQLYCLRCGLLPLSTTDAVALCAAFPALGTLDSCSKTAIKCDNTLYILMKPNRNEPRYTTAHLEHQLIRIGGAGDLTASYLMEVYRNVAWK